MFQPLGLIALDILQDIPLPRAPTRERGLETLGNKKGPTARRAAGPVARGPYGEEPARWGELDRLRHVVTASWRKAGRSVVPPQGGRLLR